MSSLDQLRRIAEIEFADIVVQSDRLGSKLRILLTDTTFVDVWASRKLSGRFGFHWERRYLDGRIYRYDNFPDTDWNDVPTFPLHFHDGDQGNVTAAPFAPNLEQGFREFMVFVQQQMGH
ncbi:MAG: hypothetical protein EHM56_11190 [Chloroflexi bacterium]|nr:MAG: hypothetical protein EHM56_11190 [Chloroflexota bacterium]